MTAVDLRLICRACGQVHAGAKLAKTEDGRELGTYSEEWRRYCEAKRVLRKRTPKALNAYLDKIQELRGVEARIELREEMARLWKHRQSQA